MAKRYGRNKKRRDRKAIARLEAENIKLTSTLAHTDGDARAMRAELERWRPKVRVGRKSNAAWDNEIGIHVVVQREAMERVDDRRWAIDWVVDQVRDELGKRLKVMAPATMDRLFESTFASK